MEEKAGKKALVGYLLARTMKVQQKYIHSRLEDVNNAQGPKGLMFSVSSWFANGGDSYAAGWRDSSCPYISALNKYESDIPDPQIEVGSSSTCPLRSDKTRLQLQKRDNAAALIFGLKILFFL